MDYQMKLKITLHIIAGILAVLLGMGIGHIIRWGI